MKKKHLRVIRNIQEGIPKELLMNLTKTELQSPTIKYIFEKALTDPSTSERQRRNIQAMLDSGKLDKEVEVLDHEVEKQIDEYFKEKIDEAVKMGWLPAQAPILETLNNKGKQYARRQEKRLRREFTGDVSDVEGDPEEEKNHQSNNAPQSRNDARVPHFSAGNFRL